MTAEISTYLKYANLQIAAEAFFGLKDAAPGTTGQVNMTVAALEAGNDHTSKFTPTEASWFAGDWSVVEHISNTSTGFSGTLFRAIKDDPERGIKKDELVLSFRSTEFVDDSVRDNQATNVLEIKEKGWAFGQIADMEKWYQDLRSSGKIGENEEFAVTGYSLGGHLATAFNLLREEERQADGTRNPISATYTFNGAGVGKLQEGSSLHGALSAFKAVRDGGAQTQLETQEGRELYLQIKTDLGIHPGISQLSSALNKVNQAINAAKQHSPVDMAIQVADYVLMVAALTRARTIAQEVDRVGHLASSGGIKPLDVGLNEIAALDLDYQLGVLVASRQTAAYALVNGAINTLNDTRNTASATIAGFHDIYASNYPSAVANSQLHYGQPTGVIVEDQPLMRGDYLAQVLGATGQTLITDFDFKLLVDHYDLNDFGDTHSLVLIVDSLSVQSTLAELDLAFSLSKFVPIMQAATREKGSSLTPGSPQGQAEGDALENLVNALARTFKVNLAQPLKGNTSGNSWFEVDVKGGYTGREALHAALKLIADSDTFIAIAGKVTIAAATGDLQAQAKTDFGALMALQTLSPFVISTTDAAAQAALLGAQGDVGTAWQADKNARLYGDESYDFSFTDQWYEDRAALLQVLNLRNSQNQEAHLVFDPRIGLNRALVFDYLDPNTGQQEILLAQGRDRTGLREQHVVFGDGEANTLVGTENALGDHLYGGEGNDTLSGDKGADYLQGDAGADSLNGGAGADTLYGGAGDDNLNGGADDDLLQGGAGYDTYSFKNQFGSDVIVDSDGAGQIQIDEITLSGGKKVAEGVWRNEVQGLTYKLVGTGASQTLLVQKTGSASFIRIQGWRNGNLGLTMEAEEEVVAASHTFIGDQRAVIETTDTGVVYYNWNLTSWAVDGTLVGGEVEEDFNDVIYGSTGDDKILGLGGNDALDGNGGNDSIDGGTGDDLIAGGVGNDTIHGGAGNDFIFTANNLYKTSFGSLKRYGPDDHWTGNQAGRTIWTQGSTWATFKDAKGINPADSSVFVDPDGEDDVAYGEAGDDAIVGGFGDDYLDGGDDNDYVWGHGGNDIIIGGAGNDALFGDGTKRVGLYNTLDDVQNGNDLLDGGDGNDTLWGNGGNDALYGGVGNDILIGDERNLEDLGFDAHGKDYLNGEDGNDTLYGGGKDDTLYGGAGADVLWGDDVGEDVLVAGYHGNDYLDGEDGDDQLIGGGKDDTLIGGLGDDMLWGDADTQQDLGGQYHGNDYLDGEEGDDILYGGGRDDTLYGGSGRDKLFGDSNQSPFAQQTLDGQYHGDDYLDGEDGDDTLYGGGKNDTLVGGSGDDLLVGDGNYQVLVAPADEGDDYMDGGAGNDTLNGGGGDDTLLGGSGTDLLQGGSGDDTYILNSGDGPASGNKVETIIDSEGTNTLMFSDVPSGNVQVSRSGGDLLLSYGQDKVLIQGGLSGAIANFVFADATWSLQDIKTRMFGATDLGDNIIGTPQADRISAGGGNDTLIGDGGDDTLIGGAGNDDIRGGDGNNRYLFDRGDGQDTIAAYASEAPNKNNVLQFGAGISAIGVEARRVDDDLVLSFAGSTDQITVKLFFWGDSPGNWAYNPVQHINFADGTVWGLDDIVAKVMGGTSSDDSIRGTWRDDFISGRDGNDTLFGNSGNDTLDGGAGNDFISGLGENDVFLFGRGDGQDTIGFGVAWTPGATTTLQFKQGIAPSDVVVRRAAYSAFGPSPDLEVSIIGTNDKVLIQYFLLSERGGAFTPSVQQFMFSDGAVWDLATIVDKALAGTPGNDTIYGVEWDRLFQGLAGNDKLYGGKGNDTLDGGAGNDTLAGESGNDVYMFGRGDGQDYIGWNYNTTPSTVDTLQFKDGVSPGDVEVRRVNDDLLLRIAGSDDQIRVGAYFYNNDTTNTYNPVQQVRFSDGTVWDLQALTTAALTGTADGETIGGTIGADTITGQGGDDWLRGSSGADTYVFGLGDGVDRIYDGAEAAGGSGNRIVFKQGIAAGSLAASLNGTTLVLHYGNRGDTITIDGYDSIKSASERVIDRIDFADGSSASLAAVLSGLPSNHAPTVGIPLSNQGVDEGTAWNFTIPFGAFADMDVGDMLRFSATMADGGALPSWLSFDASTGTFSGTAGHEDIGGIDVLVTATDQGGLSADQRFQLTVTAAGNHQPGLGASLYDQITTEGAAWTFVVPVDAFTDADPGDELQYSVVLGDGGPLPDWISFDSATRTLSGTAGHENVGNLDFRVIATDQGGLSAEQHFQLTVAASGNHQPQLGTQLSDQNLTQGITWTFVIPSSAFVDVDSGDELQYSVLRDDGSPLPDWMSFDPATRTLSGMPSNADVGALIIHVVATDNGGLSAGQYFGLEVRSEATGGGDIPETTSAGVDVTWDGWSRTSMGSAGDDVIVGGAGADWMFGGAGNDTLRAAEDPESLSSYYDYMEGNAGNDVYYVDLDSPTTTINQTGALATDVDVVRFGAGITSENLHIQQVNGSYLNISYGSQLLAQLVGWWDTDVRRIDRLEFADGTTIQGSQLDNMIESGLYTAEGYNGPIVGRGEATASFYGNEDDNVMIGGVGSDTFDPWMGNDTMAGGLGSDSYYFYRSTGADVIEEDDQPGSGSSDAVVILGDVSADQLWFSQDSNDLEVRIIGTDDRLRIKDWFSDQTHRVEEFRLESGTVLLDGQVQNLVQAMAAFSVPAAGQTTLPANYQSNLAPVIAASWQ